VAAASGKTITLLSRYHAALGSADPWSWTGVADHIKGIPRNR